MRRIGLQAAVAMAEIVTALAVVATLLYAASEFRRSQTLTSTDVQHLLYDRMLEMDRLLIESRDLAVIQVTVASHPDELTPADRARHLAYEHIFYDSWELAWTAHADGVLDEAAWRDWAGWFTAEARRRSALGWQGNRQNLSEDFVRYAEPLLTND